MSTSPSSRRFWRRLPLRLSVRTLMVLVLLVGGGVGWIVQRARAQRDIVQAIERADGWVRYGFAWLPHDPVNGDWIPDWATKIVDTIGPEYVCDVLQVHLSLRTRPDDDHDALMVQIGQLHQLRELNLNGSESVTDAGLAHLSGLTNLVDLDLAAEHVSGAALRHLSRMRKLRTLVLSGRTLRDDDLVHLTALSKLNWLRVHDSTPWITDAELAPLTDAGLVHLRGLPNLENLDLSGAHLCGSALRSLSGMANLRSLVLPGEELRDDDLAHLKGLTKLEVLSTPMRAPNITDVGLAHLSGLTNLQFLGLPAYGVTSEGLESIRTLTNLECIVLDCSKINDLTRFQNFPKLESLSLSRTPVDDAGLAAASRLTELTALDLGHTNLTDAGLAHLRPLKKLTNLRLEHTNTSSEAIIALGKIPLSAGSVVSGDTAR